MITSRLTAKKHKEIYVRLFVTKTDKM